MGEGDGFHVEEHPEQQEAHLLRLERIVQELAARTPEGAVPDAVRAELETAIAAAGLPEQPTKWVGDTATELAAGRTVNVDRDHDVWPTLTREE